MARIVLAMSGGVDSSVSAHLLQEQGHEVVGLFMRHGEPPKESACVVDTHGKSRFLPVITEPRPGHKQGCCSADDAEDGRRAADRLGIPFYAIDFQSEFGRIMDYFVDEYTAGRTPNPCVMCNNWLKFGRLWDYAQDIGADGIATGHYVQIRDDGHGGRTLHQGLDPGKDQSYVLFGIDRKILPYLHFPVGGHTKSAIRQMAAEIGLRVADKKDSYEICFVSHGHYGDFVRGRLGRDLESAGDFVLTDGTVIGQHEGYENYTVGQRKGLGVALGGRRYVVRIEPETRRVVLGERHELERSTLSARDANWLIEPPSEPIECEIKTRYQAPRIPATVAQAAGNRLTITTHEPDDQVAPGQAVVLYREDQVLGGGWIE
jgi:tRNA-specific 2-thiouridylase